MNKGDTSESIAWLLESIKSLPSDEPVPKGTQGYNVYQTQKEHWIGWLNPDAGTGTYPRQSNPQRDARDVYNRIIEPKMLVWLATAANVDASTLKAATSAAAIVVKLPSKSAAIRKHIPWAVLQAALSKQTSTTAA